MNKLNREEGKSAKGYKGFLPAIGNGGGDAAGSKRRRRQGERETMYEYFLLPKVSKLTII